ncbi:sigma-70 family RNA polymerase sigma factor [Bacillus alkalicola]|uniref:Sigma-70 family RNA polymerase sigma factor n=1 Tax=Evansella alkalicola TaxID=745819 RepID=A0ABS6JS40_9BACI|nr:sigma-70 family RNA polymerase sigma factor [Bacillus alkalicola]
MSIVERLRSNEEDALRELMDLYGNELVRTAFLLVKDRFLAEEVVQDTFIKAFHKIHQLEESEKLRNWLYIMTVNGCREKMRSWNWKNIFLSKREDEFQKIEGQEQLPEEVLLQAMRDEVLYEKIQALPYNYREVIVLYYFQELSIKDIANWLSTKENTVKTRLARGRRLLKQFFQEGVEDRE